MNKRNVENNMEKACEAINAVRNKDCIDKSLRGKMSAFGAAVMMSGVKPAVAYFAKNEPKVINMLYCVYDNNGANKGIEAQTKCLCKQEKEDILEKAVSLKLAMNMFIDDGNEEGSSDGQSE